MVSNHPDALDRVVNKVASILVVSTVAKKARETWKTAMSSPVVAQARPVDSIAAARIANL